MSSIYSILSGIIHVGNIEFVEKEVDHQTQMDISTTDILTIGKVTGIFYGEITEFCRNFQMLKEINIDICTLIDEEE